MIKHNYLYGLLTGGVKGFRNTSIYESDNPLVNKYKNILVPSSLSDKCRAFLTEFYIKLIYSDIDAIRLLKKVDPCNSYTTVAYDIVIDDNVNIEDIYTNIKHEMAQYNGANITIVDCFISVLKDLMSLLPESELL